LGQSVADLRRAAPDDRLGPAIRSHGAAYDFDPARTQNLFYHDCPNPAAHTAALRCDPIAPMQTALPDLPTALPTSLPSAAIICDGDRAIAPAYQAHMARGITLRAHLPCGHAPFFAAPLRLAQCLHDLATQMVADRQSYPPNLP
jgi:hypothetical protein